MRQPSPVERGVFRTEVPGNKSCALRVIAVGQRDPGISRGASRCRHARDNLKRNTGFSRSLQLFAAAPENKRVAAFQANHRIARFRRLYQHAVNVLLRYGDAGGAFTHADCLRVATHQLADFRRDQIVVKHHIRLLDSLQAAQGQQSSIARPRADEDNFTEPLFRLSELIFQRLFRFGFIARQHQAGKAAGKHAFPKTTAFGSGFQMGFNMMTPVARRFGQPPQVGGQQRFDFFAQNSRQHRRFAAGRDSHQQRRTIDD